MVKTCHGRPILDADSSTEGLLAGQLLAQGTILLAEPLKLIDSFGNGCWRVPPHIAQMLSFGLKDPNYDVPEIHSDASLGCGRDWSSR